MHFQYIVGAARHGCVISTVMAKSRSKLRILGLYLEDLILFPPYSSYFSLQNGRAFNSYANKTI